MMEPLSCPFCGCMPKTGVELTADSKTEMGFVKCEIAGCHVRPRVHSVMKIGEGEQSAIRRWNYRE